MRYICPDCGAGGGDHEDKVRVNLYWCHRCDHKVKMLPANNSEIFDKQLVRKMINEQMIEGLKIQNSYTEDGPKCANCNSFETDESTDNFYKGDQCSRNVDFPFPTNQYAYCDKWGER